MYSEKGSDLARFVSFTMTLIAMGSWRPKSDIAAHGGHPGR